MHLPKFLFVALILASNAAFADEKMDEILPSPLDAVRAVETELIETELELAKVRDDTTWMPAHARALHAFRAAERAYILLLSPEELAEYYAKRSKDLPERISLIIQCRYYGDGFQSGLRSCPPDPVIHPDEAKRDLEAAIPAFLQTREAVIEHEVRLQTLQKQVEAKRQELAEARERFLASLSDEERFRYLAEQALREKENEIEAEMQHPAVTWSRHFRPIVFRLGQK